MAVEHVDKTRESAIEFNVAEVRKLLASAVRMVMAGNRAVLESDDSKSEDRRKGGVESEGWNLRFRCSVQRW